MSAVPRPRTGVAAASVGALAVAVTAASIVVAASSSAGADPLAVLVTIARLAPLAVGGALLAREAGGAIARVFVACGAAVLAVQGVGVAAALVVEAGWMGGAADGVARTFADAAQLWFAPAYAWPAVVVLTFPPAQRDARPDVVARRALAVVLAGVALLTVSAPFSTPTANGAYAGAVNPLSPAWLVPLASVPFWAGWIALLGGFVATGVVAVRRLRAASGVTRLQWWWLQPAAWVPAAALVACVCALLGLLPMVLVDLGVALAQLAAVGAVVIAVADRGLYGLGRLAGRVLVGGVLVAVVVATWVLVARASGPAIGAGAAGLAAVAAFAARAGSVAAVDRRLAPRRVAARDELSAFAARVHRGEAAATEVDAVVARLLGDPTALVRDPDDAATDAATDDAQAAPEADAARVRTPVRYAGATVAVLDHDAAVLRHPDVLAVVLDEAAATIAVARLQGALQRQLRLTADSRDRVVQAAVRERRRLERDLHDGVQQRLVALGILLRRVQFAATPAGHDDAALDAAVDQVSLAIADLRALAAGVRPPRLDDGLASALRDLADTTPVPLDVAVDDLRVAPDLETAAYFVACEAITNAVKHADADRIVVRGALDDGVLRLSVTDDGRGGAVARVDGGGLAGMSDRLAAYGGRVDVVSERGRGTTVAMELPCAS